MASGAARLGSLADAERRRSLGRAKVILWIVGALTIAVHAFQLSTLQREYDRAIDSELRGREGASLVDVRALDAAERAEFDEAYDKGLRLARVLLVASIALGVAFIICALVVDRRPVAATVTGLVLYLGSLAAGLAIDPSSVVKGLLIKILIIMGLVSAVRAALAVERAERAAADA
jgi:hypothetical protein